MIGTNLALGELAKVFALDIAEVPFCRFRDGFLKIPDRLPSEEVEGFVCCQVELRGFVDGIRVGSVDPFAAEMLGQLIYKLGDGTVGGEGGAEIEAGR